MTEMVEHLPGEHKALSSNSSTAKKRKKGEKITKQVFKNQSVTTQN
jgi:hypothetical protein